MSDSKIRRERVEFAPRSVSHAATVEEIEQDREARMARSQFVVVAGTDQDEDIHKAS